MSLDRIQSKQGNLAVYPEPGSGGFPGRFSIGGEAGFVEGAAAQSGGALAMSPQPRSGTVPTLANSGTITHNGSGVAIVTNGGATTGNIIQVGSVHGQLLVVINQGSGSITMAAAGTSNVVQGTGAIIVATGAGVFVWNTNDSRWYGVEGV